jgi:hypothetical protein
MRVDTTPMLLQLQGPSPSQAKVVNNGPGSLYYKATQFVSATSNDGSIAAGASAVFAAPQWVAAAAGSPANVDVVAAQNTAQVVVADPLVGGVVILKPSGDSSGSQDIAEISRALTAFPNVTVRGGTFYINAPILMASDRTLTLQDATVKKAGNYTGNMVANTNKNATGNRNIRIKGIGRASFEGQTSAQLTATAASGQKLMSLSKLVPAGAYKVTQWNTLSATFVENITIANPNTTNAVSAPFIAQTVSNLTVQHTVDANNNRGVVDNDYGGEGLVANRGFDFVNVDDLIVEDVSIGPIPYMTGCHQLCSNVRYSRVKINQDRSISHMDGIDIGPGCNHVLFEDITGMTGDDGCSIFYKNTGVNIDPYVATLTAAQRSGGDITLRNYRVDVGINPVRIQAGDGSTLSGVHVENYVNTSKFAGFPHSVIQFGQLGFVTTPPANADFTDITLDGYKGPCDWLIGADSFFSNVHVSNVKIDGTFTALFGSSDGSIGGGDHITIDNVTTTVAAAAAGKCLMMTSVTGSRFDHVNFARIGMRASNGILVNSGRCNNLEVAHVHVGLMTGAPIQSTFAERGCFGPVTVDLYGYVGGANYTGTGIPRVVFRQPVPFFIAADTTPYPVQGSIIQCRNDKDPTGLGGTTPAQYIGDGNNWLAQTTLTGLLKLSAVGEGAGGSSTGGGTVHTLKVDNGHSVGSLLLLAVLIGTSTSAVSSVTDTRGNTWTVDQTKDNTTGSVISLCSCRPTTALFDGDILTITISVASTTVGFSLAEFYAAAATPLDKVANNSNTVGVTAIDGGTTAVLAQADELVVQAATLSGASGGLTKAAGFTLLTERAIVGGVTRALVWQYKQVTATTAVNPILTTTTARAYASVTGTYKA